MPNRQTFGDRMAALKNRRHELFAQGLAKGETQERAYELAGYRAGAHSRKAAARLATNVDVQHRAATLQDRVAVKTETTVATLVAELEQARKLAMETGQSGAMVAASMGKGKLLGLITDKVAAEVIKVRTVPTREELLTRKAAWRLTEAPGQEAGRLN